MSKIEQEDLAEALEHHEDHPVNPQEFEVDEEWIKKVFEKLNKSAEITNRWAEEQNKLWGITNEEK